MPSSSGDTGDGDDTDVLLAMYEQHREEVRAHGRRKSRRYLGSLTVLGVIIGYVFTSGGDARVLVLVPFVLAFLYLSHLSSMEYVAQLAALLALIEATLDTLGAEYEYYHGGFNVASSPRFGSGGVEGHRSSGETGDDNTDPLDARTTAETRGQRLRTAVHRVVYPFVDEETRDQRVVQTHVSDGMHLIALVAYVGSAGLGVGALATNGISTLGLTGPWAIGLSVLVVAVQAVILLKVLFAWSAYTHHCATLAAGVRAEVERDDFGVGPRERRARTDS